MKAARAAMRGPFAWFVGVAMRAEEPQADRCAAPT
ncbi:hypothetical protein M218_02200 [Burkholderia pseudomallei MSHR338]|nr:hypothetical protein BPC006_I0499 [Burkholderia pseudomallei BPC006]EQA91063.1 hypothetical protein M218_02200 [Burkholderia pseudomallei MSHR338]KGC57450.1 hypothetical protein DM75_3474 [Burkholderia mallei]VUD42410.1 unnamed protein product [Burkholderia pseudomallei]KOT08996.1 hypothetical protein DM77_2704 [Burkholderia mallei]